MILKLLPLTPEQTGKAHQRHFFYCHSKSVKCQFILLSPLYVQELLYVTIFSGIMMCHTDTGRNQTECINKTDVNKTGYIFIAVPLNWHGSNQSSSNLIKRSIQINYAFHHHLTWFSKNCFSLSHLCVYVSITCDLLPNRLGLIWTFDSWQCLSYWGTIFIPPGFANGMYLTECIKYSDYIEAISLTHTWTQAHTTLGNLQ